MLVDHVFIPDTQCRPGVRSTQMAWAGQYIADHWGPKAGEVQLRVIHAGDNWDMPSLSAYDRGKPKLMEGRRVRADIDAGNAGFKLLDDPIRAEMKRNRKFRPDLHFLFGNHEDRVTRAIEANAQIDGLLSLDMLDTRGWKRHDFLKPVTLDGVVYAHYFYAPMTGKALSGENLKLRLKNLGHSFVQGHQQTYDTAVRFVNGQAQRALVAGSFYIHDEDYKGPQGNAHWRGIIVMHEVVKGNYALMEVTLDYLCRRYEGVSLAKFKTRHYS